MDLLGDLQAVADKIDALEKRRSAAAEAKARAEQQLATAREELTAKEAEQHAVDMERRKKELQLRAEKERQQRIKGRVGDVKTSREYQAVLSETTAAKQAVQSQEEAILRDMEAIEALGAEAERIRQRIAEAEEEAGRASAHHDTECSDTEAEIDALKEEERAMIAQIPGEVVSRYKLIRSRRGGLAVVEARHEACTACFMRIPPHTYIQVLRKSGLILCPNCHRILIAPRGEVPPMPPDLFGDDD
jgi:predicted  nucleic acid-binding Zn-ribbon protein